MKLLGNKKNIKIVSLILIFLTVFLSVIPYNTFAASSAERTDAGIGGRLFNPIFKLFAASGDLVIKGLQKIFVGDGDIRIENPRKASK